MHRVRFDVEIAVRRFAGNSTDGVEEPSGLPEIDHTPNGKSPSYRSTESANHLFRLDHQFTCWSKFGQICVTDISGALIEDGWIEDSRRSIDPFRCAKWTLPFVPVLDKPLKMHVRIKARSVKMIKTILHQLCRYRTPDFSYSFMIRPSLVGEPRGETKRAIHRRNMLFIVESSEMKFTFRIVCHWMWLYVRQLICFLDFHLAGHVIIYSRSRTRYIINRSRLLNRRTSQREGGYEFSFSVLFTFTFVVKQEA